MHCKFPREGICSHLKKNQEILWVCLLLIWAFILPHLYKLSGFICALFILAWWQAFFWLNGYVAAQKASTFIFEDVVKRTKCFRKKWRQGYSFPISIYSHFLSPYRGSTGNLRINIFQVTVQGGALRSWFPPLPLSVSRFVFIVLYFYV